jgi:hypothetical protein
MRKYLIATALVAAVACGDKAAEGTKDSTMAPAPAPAASAPMDSTMKMGDSTVKKDSGMAAPAAGAPAAKKP